MTEDIALLNQKIDRLIELHETQQRQMQAVSELKQDIMPIVNSMTQIMIDELEELGEDFQIEDMTYLVKKLLRKNRLLVKAVNRMEALMDLIDEAEFMGRHVFNDAVQTLEDLENKGYFALAREGARVADRLVSEVNTEDVRQLGQRVVSLVESIRREPQDNELSIFALLKKIADPDIRRGLVRMLNMVKVVGQK